MGGDLGPSMFIWSEAETEGAGGPDLPMKIISCYLFPRRKTGTNLPREAIRPAGLENFLGTYSSCGASGPKFSLVLTAVELVLKSGILKETKHIIQ